MHGTAAELRVAYRFFLPVTTRWMDNDVYGHVNNAVYYGYFDTAVNAYLLSEGGLDVARSAVIGLCVESGCQYLGPVAFPEALEAGVRVAHLGRSSARYEVGIFRAAAPAASAQGYFVHVFVDRVTRRPVEMPLPLRTALARLGPSTPP